MTYEPLLFSLLFFAAFTVYLFFGVVTFNNNPKSNINRLFLLICFSLCLCSMGFAIANSAPSLGVCLFWRRVSALGWGTVYALLLHFLCILSNCIKNKKDKYLSLLLYIPAIISVYAFALSEKITATQFNFIKAHYGWVNAGVQNKLTVFFYAYYMGYLLACLFVLYRWKCKTTKEDEYNQANIIFYSIFGALLLGTFTDVVLSSFFISPLPQMGPLVTLLPVGAIYLSIKKYSLMKEKTLIDEELILTHETLDKVYYYIGVGFLAGGLLIALSLFFPHMINGEENLKATMSASIILFFIGFVILALRFIKTEEIKNPLIISAILVSIPIVTLMFLEYSGITVWAFPMILIVISLIFSSRILLLLITIVSILTQIVIWIASPKMSIRMDEFDYIFRIGIFILAYWIGSIVNKSYIKRLVENKYQVEFQKLISDISYDFITVNQGNIDNKINRMLKNTGQFFEVDRTYVFLFDKKNNLMSYAYEWCNEGIKSEMEFVDDLPLDELPILVERLEGFNPIYIEDVDKLDDEAAAEKRVLTTQNIKSVIIIPIKGGNELLGFVGLDTVTAVKFWSEYHMKLLKILGNLLADALIKIKAEKEIEYMAYYDHLTGLPNRNLFTDRLNQAIYLAKRNNKFIAVMLLDLDSFKTINDIMGHSSGDKVIKETGQGLVKRLRKIDTVARFGGDEYLIMINNIADPNDIPKIAKNIMGLFDKPFILNDQEFYITCSAGVAVHPVDGDDAVALIKNADIAMYKAKSRGKNQFIMCTEDMKNEVKRNITISNHLYRALERDELMLHYQPQIRLHTNKIIGLEALLRWNHPEMGMIPPNVFIPLAEKNGLINSIGEWVLKSACKQNKKWQDMGLPKLRMAVNLSIIQFNNPHMVSSIDRILKETGLSPEYLELEITESIAIKETTDTVSILNNLKELGVTISIDDFGTEYSSLNRLKMLPIDRIKIDMQFVQGIESSEKDQAITKIIINLAKSLGLEVLAEGVETKPQLEFLNQKMCDDVQGYYFYKPMPSENIADLLKNNKTIN